MKKEGIKVDTVELTTKDKIKKDIEDVNAQLEQAKAQVNYLIGYKASLEKSLEYLKND